MSPPRNRGLWLHIAIPILAFVSLGSIVIVVWLHADAQRESRNLFATLARTNAELIKTAHLPADERVASELSRVLDMQVFFRRGAWDIATRRNGEMAARRSKEIIPQLQGDLAPYAARIENLDPYEGIVPAGRNWEAIAITVDEDTTLVLVRRLEATTSLFLRPATIGVLSLFWALSVGLAWAISRGVVWPLRRLTQHLPRIATDSRTLTPGIERQDEIGELARAYQSTRALLHDERNRRAQAERLALLGRMATGLAHEIHNPLAAIRLHAQLLDSAEGEDFVQTARETLPVLLDETSRIEGLVNQWMFLARPVPPQTSRTDIAEIVTNVIRNNRALATHAGVQIIERLHSSLWAAIDGRRMTQAVRNVVVNAIQAMPTGGTLTITGELHGGNVRITFADTGPGFSAAALARHAELFYSEKEGGMGIGLNVSTEILKAHRGVLTVNNGPSGGALVTFLVPAL
ncbi:ATP-binding protein [Verrucomicrobiota bacterium sgz303538]